MAHTNVSPMTPAQRLAYAASLRKLASLGAQANTADPQFAVETLLWLADQYENPDQEWN